MKKLESSWLIDGKMENGAAAGENIWWVGGSSRSQLRLSVWSSNSAGRRTHPRKRKNAGPHVRWYENIHSGTTRNSQKAETAHALLDHWVGNHKLQIHSGILFSREKAGKYWSTATEQENPETPRWARKAGLERLHVAGIHLHEISRTEANLQKWKADSWLPATPKGKGRIWGNEGTIRERGFLSGVMEYSRIRCGNGHTTLWLY